MINQTGDNLMTPEMRTEGEAIRQAVDAAGADIPRRMWPLGVTDLDGQRTLILMGETTGFLYAVGEHIAGFRRRLTTDEFLRIDEELNGKPKTPGGARPGAGRKPADGKSGSRRQVVLDDETIEICRQAGGGELSAGIRAVAAAYRGLYRER